MQSKPKINRVSLGTKREQKQKDGFVSRAMAVSPTVSFLKRNLETKPSAHSGNAITVKVDFRQGGAHLEEMP